jgi:hypothetical protein
MSVKVEYYTHKLNPQPSSLARQSHPTKAI